MNPLQYFREKWIDRVKQYGLPVALTHVFQLIVRFFYRKDSNIVLVVPDHKEIDRGTLAEIIRQAGLKRHEFLRLVK